MAQRTRKLLVRNDAPKWCRNSYLQRDGRFGKIKTAKRFKQQTEAEAALRKIGGGRLVVKLPLVMWYTRSIDLSRT